MNVDETMVVRVLNKLPSTHNSEIPSCFYLGTHLPEEKKITATPAVQTKTIQKKSKPNLYLVIKRFPGIIIIRGLAHQRIRHGQTAQAGIIQVTKSVRSNLRHQLLHHRGACLPLRHNHWRLLQHFHYTTVQIRHSRTGQRSYFSPGVQTPNNHTTVKRTGTITIPRTQALRLKRFRPPNKRNRNQSNGGEKSEKKAKKSNNRSYRKGLGSEGNGGSRGNLHSDDMKASV